jgi:RNA polymerase sigma factor (sigma-70 family)
MERPEIYIFWGGLCPVYFFCFFFPLRLLAGPWEEKGMKKFIKIGKEQVPVSEEIYKEFYRMDRRERYMEKDVKVGRMVVDPKAETVEYIPSKEDSINRLMDLGGDFEDDQMIEDILCDKATLLILQEAMAELNEKEQELIKALYYKDLTVREVAKEENISHVAVIKRRNKVLDKLKKYFL